MRFPPARSFVLAGAACLLIGADDPLGRPRSIRADDIVAAPSAAVRSAALALAEQPLTVAVSIHLLCAVEPEGSIDDCLPEGAPLDADADWSAFARASGLDAKDKLDHSLVALARLRARQTLLKPRETKKPYLARLTETVSPGDLVHLDTPARTLKRAEIKFTSLPNGEFVGHLYPRAASRQDARARVTAMCRIRADHSLFCRGGKANSNLRPGDAEDFVFATYQVFSLARVEAATPGGQPIAGNDVELTLNWSLTASQ